MKSLHYFFTAALLAATCGAGEAGEASAQTACDRHAQDGSPLSNAGGWHVYAGPVTWAHGDPPQVSGTFEVCAPRGENRPEAAPRQGGACLVADLVERGIGRAACTTHADCNPPGAFDGEDPGLANYHGYCLAQDGSDEPPRCWTRPGRSETYCRRSVDGLVLTAGTHQLAPVNGDPQGAGAPYPRWAVIACMAHVGHDRACGDPESSDKQVSVTPGR